MIFAGEIEQQQPIWCLKCKSLDMNILCIEWLYKINITFAVLGKVTFKSNALQYCITP